MSPVHRALWLRSLPRIRHELNELGNPEHALVIVFEVLDTCGVYVVPKATAARTLMKHEALFCDWVSMPPNTIMIILWPSGEAPVIGSLGLRRVPRRLTSDVERA